MQYQLVAGLLPDNLSAQLVGTQRRLFSGGISLWALAFPPIIPIHWCTADPIALRKLMTHSPPKKRDITPLSTTGWIEATEPDHSPNTPFLPAAVLGLRPARPLRRFARELKERVSPGPALFGGGGTLVLAISPRGEGVTEEPPSRDAERRTELPAVPTIRTRVLQLALVGIEANESGVAWDVHEISWFSP